MDAVNSLLNGLYSVNQNKRIQSEGFIFFSNARVTDQNSSYPRHPTGWPILPSARMFLCSDCPLDPAW